MLTLLKRALPLTWGRARGRVPRHSRNRVVSSSARAALALSTNSQPALVSMMVICCPMLERVSATCVPTSPAPQMMIRGGSLLRADGGFLVLEGRDLLMEPGAWKTLIRTLRSGSLEMVPPAMPVPWQVTALKPDPIPINVKIVLLGDAERLRRLQGSRILRQRKRRDVMGKSYMIKTNLLMRQYPK